jgi:DNA-binding NarL/FixJ family response regulator
MTSATAEAPPAVDIPADAVVTPTADPTAPPDIIPADDPDDLIERMVAYLIAIAPNLASKRKAITADMRKEFGGQRWYVHSRQPTERQQRIADILSHFNGRNASEVARKLKVSRATVYRYIKQPGRVGK